MRFPLPWRRSRPTPPPPRVILPEPDWSAPLPVDRAPFETALSASHGTTADGALLAAVAQEMHARRARTGTLEGPPSPTATGLTVRREGLPDWWHPRRNLLLCAPETPHLEIGATLLDAPPEGAIVVIGRNVAPPRLNLTVGLGRQGPPMIVLGDDLGFIGGGVSTFGPSTVLIGEKTSATFNPGVTAHNGGMVLIGPDNMWGPGVVFMTDDSHAILDVETGRRINRYGGRIVIGSHVWLGWQAGLMGDTVIGDGCVVGQGSLVRNLRVDANTMVSGRPARAGRSGITWSREDVAPD